MSKSSKMPGLTKIGKIWHIDKKIRGRRLCESTGTSNLREAEIYLVKRIEEIRKAEMYGERPVRTFMSAATKYLNETRKSSLERDAQDIKLVVPYIGHLSLEKVHMGTLQPFIDAREADGVKSSTVNRTLAVVRRILNLSAGKWRDEFGLTWLATSPMFEMQDWKDRREPYPLSWEEQRRLFRELPPHLQRMALFTVNTGTRQEEVCGLKWEWECSLPELNTSVFIIPGEGVKNNEDRVVVLNRVARSIVDELRGQHPTYVFTYKGKRIGKINNTGWKNARKRAGLPQVREHDLKHTFGRRLRAAGVPMETRKVLLGHKNGDITTHYSAPEICELIEAAEKVCGDGSRKTPELTLLNVRKKNVIY
jgi:integrase